MWNRLKGKEQISILFKQGKRLRQKQVSIVYLKHKANNSGFYFSVGVPKRCIPKAVERNRIKRQLRAAVYAFVKESNPPMPGGVFMLNFIGRKIEKSPELHHQVRVLLTRYCTAE